ncbi:MAG: Ferrous-iron efflux pump FieF [Chlamydiae bacterium]|nr:Ferrous-iron efflux pump FieF [Chlamydiota bacterium]
MGYSKQEKDAMNRAMRLSLAVGFFLLIVKVYAFFLTGSTAILSDAAESVVHVFAVGFAAYSMWLSHKPADQDHTYGHDRIAFFSAGIEGGMILIAALFILYQSVERMVFGFTLENLDQGMVFVLIATVLNGGLGIYLVNRGKKFHSFVLQADGKHILTDCWTSIGVLLALVLTRVTRWIYFDPIIAFGIGLNILWTSLRLLGGAFHGLMDRIDPKLDEEIREKLERMTEAHQVSYHHLRHRNAGNRLVIEVHLLFPEDLALSSAHEIATLIEKKMERSFAQPTELVTHLEPLEGHDAIHTALLGREG